MEKKSNSKSKTAGKKAVKGSKKTKSKQNSEKNELLNQLKKLIKDLNEEGLLYMIKQAQVLLYNIQVEKINEERRRLATSDQMRGKTAKSDKYTIDIKEADDDSHFIIIINNYRNFFDREEMRKIVRICHASEDESDASRRLFNWFSKNRIDVLNNTDIDGVNDPALATIYNFLIKRYAVRDDS